MRLTAPKTLDPESKSKLRELMLYISWKCRMDRSFGATKLNKLLFFCDFLAYLKLGSPITGVTYYKHKLGPIPTSLPLVRSEMMNDRDIVIQNVEYATGKQDRMVPLREAELDQQFTARQIALVDEVLRRFSRYTTRQISDESHKFIGWKLAEHDEAIPYSVALMDAETLLGEESEFSESVAN